MKASVYKIIALVVAIPAIFLLSIGQRVIYAGHQKPVSSAVESARRQDVPEEILTRLLAYALDNRLGADRTVHLLLLLIRVREAQFPLSPFVDKIHEGLAKQIKPERLENGLNKRLDDYQFVRQLLEKKYASSRVYSESDLTVLVESLDFGITREELRLLFDQAPAVPPEMLAVAAKNKALLKQLSFDEGIIDDILFTGLATHSLTSRWSLFFKVAAAAERRGIPPARIAEAAKNVLIQKGDLEQVLMELEFTSRDVRHGPHLDSPPGPDEVSQ
jgi:hypothetical protein